MSVETGRDISQNRITGQRRLRKQIRRSGRKFFSESVTRDLFSRQRAQTWVQRLLHRRLIFK